MFLCEISDHARFDNVWCFVRSFAPGKQKFRVVCQLPDVSPSLMTNRPAETIPTVLTKPCSKIGRFPDVDDNCVVYPLVLQYGNIHCRVDALEVTPDTDV